MPRLSQILRFAQDDNAGVSCPTVVLRAVPIPQCLRNAGDGSPPTPGGDDGDETGFPIRNVGHDDHFLSSPQVVGGAPYTTLDHFDEPLSNIVIKEKFL